MIPPSPISTTHSSALAPKEQERGGGKFVKPQWASALDLARLEEIVALGAALVGPVELFDRGGQLPGPGICLGAGERLQHALQ